MTSDDDAVAHEEARVLDFQRTLDWQSPRPWDVAGLPAKEPLVW